MFQFYVNHFCLYYPGGSIGVQLTSCGAFASNYRRSLTGAEFWILIPDTKSMPTLLDSQICVPAWMIILLS